MEFWKFCLDEKKLTMHNEMKTAGIFGIPWSLV
jgi:hypothetical protein